MIVTLGKAAMSRRCGGQPRRNSAVRGVPGRRRACRGRASRPPSSRAPTPTSSIRLAFWNWSEEKSGNPSWGTPAARPSWPCRNHHGRSAALLAHGRRLRLPLLRPGVGRWRIEAGLVIPISGGDRARTALRDVGAVVAFGVTEVFAGALKVILMLVNETLSETVLGSRQKGSPDDPARRAA